MAIPDLATEAVLALPAGSDETPAPVTEKAGAASEAPAAPDPETAVITRTRESALAFGKELIHALSANLRQGELSQLEAIWELLPYHVSVVHVANLALTKRTLTVSPPPAQEEDPAVSQYFISSRFLAECATYTLADPHGFERMCLVTGLALEGNRFTLEQMIPVAHAHQSATRAGADQQALTQALIALSQSGHALHGLFHSHPGASPAMTHPSDIDIPTHQRLEDGGYPLIGAIFAKGHPSCVSYVRFFSANRPFSISIYGAGVTPLPGETNVFKVETTTLQRRVSYETTPGS